MPFLFGFIISLVVSVWLLGPILTAIIIGTILLITCCLCGVVGLIIGLAIMGDM